MPVLGIETSCDETGVALYEGDRGLLAEALSSQVALHARHGGVVPELASRDHVVKLAPLIRRVLAEADVGLDALDGIAYTAGPGLLGALMVGGCVAGGLGYGLGCPVIPLHHMEAHLLAPLIDGDGPDFPFVALLVSGGHCLLVDVTGVGQYKVLGQTLDDAVGEAFDKVARLLALPYPGGPAIAELAERGDPNRYPFPRPLLKANNLDFSFSGLKTAVRLAVDRHGPLNEQAKADMAASFQAAAVDTLTEKSVRALDHTGHRRLIIAGGVAANRRLRKRIKQLAQQQNFSACFPPPALCTDNGAMIAFAGWQRRADAIEKMPPIIARARWSLEELVPPGSGKDKHG